MTIFIGFQSLQTQTAASPRCRRRAMRTRPLLLFLVHPLAQLLAGLEMRHELLRHVDLLARFRIPAGSSRPGGQAEAAEAADLDALTLHQALRHRVEDHLDGEFCILGDELGIARRQPGYEFGLRHAREPPGRFRALITARSVCRASPSGARPGWCCRRSPRSRSAAWPWPRSPRPCPSP